MLSSPGRSRGGPPRSRRLPRQSVHRSTASLPWRFPSKGRRPGHTSMRETRLRACGDAQAEPGGGLKTCRSEVPRQPPATDPTMQVVGAPTACPLRPSLGLLQPPLQARRHAWPPWARGEVGVRAPAKFSSKKSWFHPPAGETEVNNCDGYGCCGGYACDISIGGLGCCSRAPS